MLRGKLNIRLFRKGNHAPALETPHAFIDLRDVRKVYEGPSGGFLALKGINLKIQAGEFVAIAGKSGSGKSTLLNMIAGIDRPTSGEITINGTAIHKLDEEQLTIWRGDALGIVFQFFQLLPTMTLLENVILPMDFCHRLSARGRREKALKLLKEVGLEEQSNRLPSNISGGQQQRVAIARALANDPPMIIADEPTGNLDSASAEAIFHMLEGLVAQGKTVVIVTHDRDLASRCQRIITIADGQIVSDVFGGPGGQKTEARPAQPEAAQPAAEVADPEPSEQPVQAS